MYNTGSTEHNLLHVIVIHNIVIIVLHIHTRAGTRSRCNDAVASKLTMVIPDIVCVISDVTFNKVVGYNICMRMLMTHITYDIMKCL